MPEREDATSRLERLFATSRRAVVFTGAGLSTECGVPDFRSPGSPWLTHPPIDYRSFMASEAMRTEAWRRKFAMDDLWSGAKPGAGHVALAHLVASGVVACVVTQNIDNLHQASGVPDERLVELHGNGTYAACLACGERHELADIRVAFDRGGAAPACRCGGAVKSATVAFGQQMPEQAMRRAREETLACDLFVVVGSSLVVHPAAAFPAAARRNGATLAILNREPTPLDAEADVVLRGEIGAILGPLANFERSG